MRTAIATAGKAIVTVSMGALTAFLMMGSIAVPPDYEAKNAEADEQPYNWQESLIYVYDDYASEPERTDTTELSTEKSTTHSTGLFYISTGFSTDTVKNSEFVSEPKTYNGISEGDIIVGEITYYCACFRCNGKYAGITASGYVIENGVQSYTAARNWLKFGTIVEIDGIEYTIRDRGGKQMNEVGRIDIYEPYGHAAALENGRRKGVDLKVVSLP